MHPRLKFIDLSPRRHEQFGEEEEKKWRGKNNPPVLHFLWVAGKWCQQFKSSMKPKDHSGSAKADCWHSPCNCQEAFGVGREGETEGGCKGRRTLHFPNVKLHFKRLQRHLLEYPSEHLASPILWCNDFDSSYRHMPVEIVCAVHDIAAMQRQNEDCVRQFFWAKQDNRKWSGMRVLQWSRS